MGKTDMIVSGQNHRFRNHYYGWKSWEDFLTSLFPNLLYLWWFSKGLMFC